MKPSTYFISLWSFFAWFTPVVMDPTSPEIKALRRAGFEIQGRDPLYGTGMCGPFLPANRNEEVYYAELPQDNWRPGLLDNLQQFPNLFQITAKRPLAPSEYRSLRRLLSGKVRICAVIRGHDSDLLPSGKLYEQSRQSPPGIGKGHRKLAVNLLKQLR